MSYAARAHRWNRWYDRLPETWRFQVVLWPLLLIGAINMALTISSGFPFGLLVILAILLLAFIRLPYRAGWSAPPDVEAEAEAEAAAEMPAEPAPVLGHVGWVWDLNQRYDALPEWRRFWVFPAVLVVAGAINMGLTLGYGFPFALLFLLALLVMLAIRGPYVWGWIAPPGAADPDTTPAYMRRLPAASASIAADHEAIAVDPDDAVRPTPTAPPVQP